MVIDPSFIENFDVAVSLVDDREDILAEEFWVREISELQALIPNVKKYNNQDEKRKNW